MLVNNDRNAAVQRTEWGDTPSAYVLSAAFPFPQVRRAALHANGTACQSAMLRSSEEKAMPILVTGRPSRRYFSA